MARWALFAAHRGRAGGAAVPRQFGPDGRELLRPWRGPRAEVEAQVRRIRAARRQPIGWRALGYGLLVVAGVAALHPVDPVARHVAGSASARTVPGLVPLRLAAPAGDLTAPPMGFHWSGPGATGAHTLVVCDASYSELTRVAGIEGASWPVSPAVAALLAGGGTFHWFVEAGEAAAPSRSTLESFTVPSAPNGR